MGLLCARKAFASRTSGMYLDDTPILLSQHKGGDAHTPAIRFTGILFFTEQFFFFGLHGFRS